MITISPDELADIALNYNRISLFVDMIIYRQNIWPLQKKPPAPISIISLIRPFIENVISNVSPKLISIGKPLVGLDWIIPYKPDSKANLISLNTIFNLAYEQNAVIQFDEMSQTPYFYYNRPTEGANEQHIVWFTDARSIKALSDVSLSAFEIMTITIYEGIILALITTFNMNLNTI